MCQKCQRETEWLSKPEYFCSRHECGRLLPNATEPGICDECKKLKSEAKTVVICKTCGKKPAINGKEICIGCSIRAGRKKKEALQKTIRAELRPGAKPCRHCGKVDKLPARGLCWSCYESTEIRAKYDKLAKPASRKSAPKTGAEKTNVTPAPASSAADTIHARPMPTLNTPSVVAAFRNIVEVKILHPAAKMPEYKTPGAAGFDLCATSSRLVRPGESERFLLGLAFAIPEGFEVQIRPRSGLSFNTPLMAKNTIGTIDSDYRGEIAFILYNTGKEPVYIEAGDRICQGVLARVPRADFMLVDELSETDRGAGGFGSTGK